MTGTRLQHVTKEAGRLAGVGGDISPLVLRRSFAAHRRGFSERRFPSPN